MKNRLELAKRLLKEDGIIFVQCDYKEQAYLKVLMDNIFTRQNFINMISIKSSTPSGVKVSHANKTILKSQDFILAYKIKENVSLKPQYQLKEKWDTHYMYFIDEDKNKIINLVDKLKHEKLIGINDTINDFDINNEKHKEFYLKNAKDIVRKSTHSNKKIKEIANSNQYINNLYFHEDNGYYYLNNDMLQPIYNSIKTVLDGINLKKDISNVLCDFWDDIDFQNTQNQGCVSFPAGKKPEQLLYRLFDMSTVKGDLVLDFHLGSGTTAAVAHKMGRRYIGVEQMDYIEDITVERLKKVIEGEQGGISKAVNWQGGGSFVYCELMENGNDLIREIENADENTIKDVKAKIYKDERIIPYITREDLEKVDGDFEELNLEDKKKVLIKLVDKNKLYVNYSDIDDADFEILEADKKFTNSFYEVD